MDWEKQHGDKSFPGGASANRGCLLALEHTNTTFGAVQLMEPSLAHSAVT